MSTSFRSRRKAVKIRVNEEEETTIDKLSPPDTNNSYDTSSSALQLNQSTSSKISLTKEHDENYDINTESESKSCARTVTDSLKASELSFTVKKKDKKKNKNQTSKLSFALGDIITENGAEVAVVENSKSGILSLKRQAVTSAKFRKGLISNSLPRSLTLDQGERPTYSKDYLAELKNATPIRRQELDDSSGTNWQDESLIATTLGLPVSIDPEINVAVIPSEAEIREKKERRARLAQEADFISFNEDFKDRQIITQQSQKTESRLVRDDEDFAEGFDEFVNDENIVLGKKQERQARRRKRKEIAELIEQAECSSNEGSIDSGSEQFVAYEEVQTRAGMYGLSKHKVEDDTLDEPMPVNITQLPILSECLEHLESTLNNMESELNQQKSKLLDAEQEERDIAARENEVQAFLTQAGDRLAAITSELSSELRDSVAQNSNSNKESMNTDRGLENYGG